MLLRFYRKIVCAVMFLGVQTIANKTRSIHENYSFVLEFRPRRSNSRCPRPACPRSLRFVYLARFADAPGV